MRKIITKIICCTAATVAALGMTFATACSGSYRTQRLPGDTSGTISSNGGFAVEKGDYVYFINGRENNTADNAFGKPVKGAIMRIAVSDLNARRYSSVQTVVPQIAYSGSYNGGLFVYGNKIYYATPSTEKNSDGEVQNSNIAFKSANLDGTEAMKDYYVQYSDNSVEYRYVEVNNVVYLIYVATNEDYYDNGSSYTNIHSVNTSTGANTLLAYNVDTVLFDSSDAANPRVYYTMNVTDYKTQNPTASTTYNQVWTVSADANEPKDYSDYFKEIYGDDYKPDKDPLYVNCGKLVYDGIGKIEHMTGSNTDFNGEGVENAERPAYKYTLSRYTNDTLFYTRKSTLISTETLFAVKDSEIDGKDWKAVEGAESRPFLLRDGGSSATYNYLFKDGELDSVLITDSHGIIKTKVVDGQMNTKVNDSDCYYITGDGQPTVLFTQVHDNKNYVYYSVSGTGANGYTVYRVCYDGAPEEYEENLYPVKNEVNPYTPVRLLDVDCLSDWYKPELIEGQLLFPTQTENMVSYQYIMACDLRVRENGAATKNIMSNEQIKDLSDKYADIKKNIDAIDKDTYENLPGALKYAFFTNDGDYIYDLCKAYKEIGKDYNNYWSAESLIAYDSFMEATGDWEKKYADAVTVNDEEVKANKRDYYYSVLGKMSEEDAKAYNDGLKSSYMQAYPEKTLTWFESLSTGAKVGFVIGVVAGGLILIGAGVVVALIIVRKRKEKLPEYTKKRVKVDTTDDKNIDVYADDNSSENK